MPDWLIPIAGSAVGGAMSGLMILAGLRVEVRLLREFVKGVNDRLNGHIDSHNARAA